MQTGSGMQQKEPTDHRCCSVLPSKEYLMEAKIQTNLKCPVINCDHTFSTSSSLNFHLEKSHRIQQKRETNCFTKTKAKSKQEKELENCTCKYFCPEIGCKYNNSDKWLPTFHSLKNHFIRMHGTKLMTCSKCSKAFGIKSELNRHQETCGLIFKCSCGCFYSTRNALLKHQKLKNHFNSKITCGPVTPRITTPVQKIKNIKPLPCLAQTSSQQPKEDQEAHITPASKIYEVQTRNSISCQTLTLNTMAASSQTMPRSESENEISSLAQTQTSESIGLDLTNLDEHGYLLMDAATSPLHLFDSIGVGSDNIWNEISTQTNLSSFRDNNTNNDNGNYIFKEASGLNHQGNLVYDRSITRETREIQTSMPPLIDMCTQTRPAVSTSTRPLTIDSSSSMYHENHEDVEYAYSMSNVLMTPVNNARCLTPNASTNTEQLNVTSIHTQTRQDDLSYLSTNTFVDTITQTDWDFSFT